jgi:ribA/ribD-fused uncharacterized protein
MNETPAQKVYNINRQLPKENTGEPPFKLEGCEEDSETIKTETKPDVRIVQGPNDPLSNFFMSPMRFGSLEYPSVEHGYQNIRAIHQGLPDIANDILNARTASQAKFLSRYFNRTDSKSEDLLLMEKLLITKNEQSKEFRNELEKSKNKTLVHSTSKKDTFWASGLLPHEKNAAEKGEYKGNNHFGLIFTKLKEKERKKKTRDTKECQSEGLGHNPPHTDPAVGVTTEWDYEPPQGRHWSSGIVTVKTRV